MKFILTKELGRLSKWLRILGFDTVYFNQDNISSLIIQTLRDNRIIITRNHRLPKSGGVKIMLIKAEKIKEQISEVLKTLKITHSFDMMFTPLEIQKGKTNLRLPKGNLSLTGFTRCIICNEELDTIDKEKIKDKVPEYVFRTQEDFITCPKCKRIYWQGTHWGNVRRCLEEITESN